MSNRSKNAGNMYRHTSFRNSGRIAGDGIVEDDYSEESFGRGRCYPDKYIYPIWFPSDGVKPEELNGPCIIIQEAKRKD